MMDEHRPLTSEEVALVEALIPPSFPKRIEIINLLQAATAFQDPWNLGQIHIHFTEPVVAIPEKPPRFFLRTGLDPSGAEVEVWISLVKPTSVSISCRRRDRATFVGFPTAGSLQD